MKEPKLSIVDENPEQTLFDRMSTAQILGIGISTLGICITAEELPRVKIKKRTYFLRADIEKFILRKSCNKNRRHDKKVNEQAVM